MIAKSPEETSLEASLLHNGKITNWDSQDTWDDVADLYDQAIGRATRNGALRMIQMAHEQLPFDDDGPVGGKSTAGVANTLRRRAIDLGAGTGSVALPLAERFPSLDILAVDISAGMLKQLSAKASPHHAPIATQVADISAPLSPVHSAEGCSVATTAAAVSGGSSSTPALSQSLAGTFTHTVSMAAVQATSDNAGCVRNMWDLLAPGGCCAVGNWDFENECAVHDVWALAATAADPTYTVPPIMPPGRWSGMEELAGGMAEAGFVDLRREIVKCDMPVDDGTEGFVRWFFQSKNPAPAERLSTFKGDKEVLEAEMRRVLNERYRNGTKLIMDVDVVVGTKPERTSVPIE